MAMQYNPNITAVVNLAAAETNPSAIAACSAITQHALVIAGGNDCVTPPTANQLAMYNALGSNCKVYVSIDGASHCQFANSNFNCTFGELTCTPAAAISRATQHSIVNSLIIPWLKFELENDCTAGLAFELLVTNPTGFTAQKNCYFCTVSIDEVDGGMSAMEVYPSVGNGIIQIKNGSANTLVTVYSPDGKKVALPEFRIGGAEAHTIDLTSVESGLYLMRFQSPTGHVVTRKVVVSH